MYVEVATMLNVAVFLLLVFDSWIEWETKKNNFFFYFEEEFDEKRERLYVT